MSISRNRLLRLGAMVITGLVIFIASIYYLGNKQNIFSSTIKVNTYFSDVKGLSEGSNVRYAGINIGTVSKIEIIQDSTILVEMLIESKVREFIRKNSTARIGNNGLMGSKIVNISPGSTESESVEDGYILQSVEMIDFDDVLEQAGSAFNYGRQVSRNIYEITEKINDGKGDLARLINNNIITSKLSRASDEIFKITENLTIISERIKNGEGDLGRMVNDTNMYRDFGSMIKNIDSLSVQSRIISDELSRYVQQMNNGNGILNKLAFDSLASDRLDTTIIRINDGIDSLMEVTNTIDQSWILNLFRKRRD